MKRTARAIVIQQRKSTFEVLEKLDYQVMEAKDCIDGIRKIIRFQPDIVITNLDVPNLNGLSMANILNSLDIKIPLIITALSETKREKALRYSNVQGFIRSADITAKLKEVIKEILATGLKEQKLYDYSFRQHEWTDLLDPSERKKLLLIEDSGWMRKACLTILDHENEYALFSAKNGKEGILKALAIKPDLILCDIEMPVMNGLVMSQTLFIINKPFPIIFLSAIQDDKTQKKARNIDGVLGYMDKAVMKNHSAFIEEIEKHLRSAATLKIALEDTYNEGSMSTLISTGEEDGVFKAGSRFTPNTDTMEKLREKHSDGVMFNR